MSRHANRNRDRGQRCGSTRHSHGGKLHRQCLLIMCGNSGVEPRTRGFVPLAKNPLPRSLRNPELQLYTGSSVIGFSETNRSRRRRKAF
jgi:hypothetical protein